MNKIFIVSSISIILASSLEAQSMNAETGIRFLQREMKNPILDTKIFENKSGPYELRLFIGGQIYGSKNKKLIQLRTEKNKSELYLFDEKLNNLVKISNYEQTSNGYFIKYNDMEFTFVCSLGAAFVVID